ncbi:hypothetical protein C2845_PM14G10310 [Panicum miliaceum]|uniref:Ribonuclease H1 N-terminal domain-containing protein n=1 Tax=Panicum miliaceum TaxID=4540 RepID=A0A3L6PLA5_PANMI|nr:hypothetical protein C2845_PM14G10310 [Panicum miliaceum]
MGTQNGPAADGKGKGEASSSGLKRKRGLSEEEGQMYGGLIKSVDGLSSAIRAGTLGIYRAVMDVPDFYKEAQMTNTTRYVVFWERKPGVYGDWGLCQAQVSGFSNTNYKKYKTMEEAVHAYESFILATRGTLEHQIPEKCTRNNLAVENNIILEWKDVVIALLLVGVFVVLLTYSKK